MDYNIARVISGEVDYDVWRQIDELRFSNSNEARSLVWAYPSNKHDGKVMYVKDRDWNIDFYSQKLTHTSYTKWLRSIQKIVPRLTDRAIEIIQSVLVAKFSTAGMKHRIATGDEIYRAYSVASSCMVRSDALDLYAQNPDKVGVVVVVDASGIEFARALLWQTDQGTPYLDRIYPSDGGSHIEYLSRLAEKENWWLKEEHSVGGGYSGPSTMSVTLKDVGAYPYLDTFMWGRRDGRNIIVSTVETGMYDWAEMSRTDNRDPWIEEDAVIGYTRSGDEVTEDDYETGDYTWDSGGNYLVYYTDVVIPINDRWECVYDENYLPSNIVRTIDGDYLDLDYDHEYVQIDWGSCKGEYVPSCDAQFHEESEFWIHEDDWDTYLEEIGENDTD